MQVSGRAVAALRAAVPVGGPHREDWPAFQAVRAICALEPHAEVEVAFFGWGCDVRGAEHRACRSETGAPSRRRHRADQPYALWLRCAQPCRSGDRRSLL